MGGARETPTYMSFVGFSLTSEIPKVDFELMESRGRGTGGGTGRREGLIKTCQGRQVLFLPHTAAAEQRLEKRRIGRKAFYVGSEAPKRLDLLKKGETNRAIFKGRSFKKQGCWGEERWGKGDTRPSTLGIENRMGVGRVQKKKSSLLMPHVGGEGHLHGRAAFATLANAKIKTSNAGGRKNE